MDVQHQPATDSWHLVNSLRCSLCPKSGESLGRMEPLPEDCNAVGAAQVLPAVGPCHGDSSIASWEVLVITLHHHPGVILYCEIWGMNVLLGIH